jgi:hypothetical protein
MNKDTLNAFWQKHKDTIIKVGTVVALLPILVPVGLLLFWLLSLAFSLVAALVVLVLGVITMLMVWIYVQDYVLRRDLPDASDDSDNNGSETTQPVDVKVIK